jgi:hypothetical protein
MPELRSLSPVGMILVVEDDPGIPPGQSHDPFAGLPGPMRLALDEGKAIGTALMKANVGERDLSMRYLPRQHIKDTLQRASANAPAALAQVYTDHRGALLGVVNGFATGRIDRNEARVRSSKLIRESYEKVREIARRASAVDTLAHEGHVYAEEEKWFRSAVREEVGYFHAFLEDVRAQRARNIPERVEAYVKALRFMYEAARVQAMPDNVLLYWTGPRQAQDEHVCDGCEYLMERSPFTKDNIPAVPRDGCVVSQNALVSTARGPVPIAEVQIGDFVWTHCGRWRAVYRTFQHQAKPHHRYAVVVGEGGRLFGVTDDHRVFTSERGWITAAEAARAGLLVVREADCRQEPQQEGALPDMRDAREWDGAQATEGRPHQEQLRDDEGGRPEVREVLGRQYGEVAVHLPLSLGVGVGSGINPGRRSSPSQERRSDRRPIAELGAPHLRDARAASRGESEAAAAILGLRDVQIELHGVSPRGRESAEVLLYGVPERELSEVAAAGMRSLRAHVPSFPFGDGEGACEGSDDDLLLDGVLPRKSSESTAYEVLAVRGGCRGEEVLLSELLARCDARDADNPAVRLLRHDLRAQGVQDARAQVGSVVLLQGVLESGAPLYDLAVEDDQSFAVDGVMIHNSTQCLTNCRHRILVRVARDLNEVVRRRAVVGKRETMIRRLNELKAEAGLGRRMPATVGVAKNPFKNDIITKQRATRIPTRRRGP